MGVHVVRREKPCAASAVGIQEGSLARPLHYPGQVMAQNHRICQGIAGLIEHAVHGGSRILGQGIVTADTEQIRPVELPAVAFGLVYALSGDDHVIRHGGNGNRAVLVGRRGDVLPSHDHGDMQCFPDRCRQIHGIAISADDHLIVTVVGGYAIQMHGDRMGFHRIGRIGNNRLLYRFGDHVHTKTVGVKPSVTNLLRLGQSRVQIHYGHTVSIAYGCDGCIQSFHQRRIRCALTNALEMVKHIDFSIGIPLDHLIQHDGRSLHGGGRSPVTVSRD